MSRLSDVLKNNPSFLAPMAGITDLPSRHICSEFNVGATVSELVSVKGFIHSIDKTLPLMKRSSVENCFGIQIMGSIPEEMGYVAGEISKNYDCDFIDINFGCPARKVTKSGSGVALMENLPLAEKIIQEVVKNSVLPVTVKMRIGIADDSETCIELSQMAENAGAKVVFIHGRSKNGLFSGKIHYNIMKKLTENVNIPVIGNGGINTVEDARLMLKKSKCKGLMIGMGAMGKPWLFKDIASIFESDEIIYDTDPEIKEVCDLIFKHGEMAEIYNGVKKLIPFRKHLLWYTKGWPCSAALRRELVTVTEMNELKIVLRNYVSIYG